MRTDCYALLRTAATPRFHILGNFTGGDGAQPAAINDVSSIIEYKGVWHIFHQFGQCGWAHAVSRDLAHWKNLRYPLIPGKPTDPDAKGCWDGSLTMDAGVNGGHPVILYGTPGNEYNIARPADLDDAELTYWTKDATNPVSFINGSGPSWQPGQIWHSSDHLNFVAAGQRYFSEDLKTMHNWTALPRGAGGFPSGGNGGQWFQRLPMTVDGTPAPAGSPTHVISTSGRSPGFPFVLGWYHAANESFTSGQVWNADAGSQFTWASMQLTGQHPPRMMIVAWISASGISPTPALPSPSSEAQGEEGQTGPQGPNSALSLMREIRFDVAIGNLVSNPVPELALLRNGTLFSQGLKTLLLEPGTPGKLYTLPLVGGEAAGATMDLETVFVVPKTAGALRFGMAVLASPTGLLNATVIHINISAPDAAGHRQGIVYTAIGSLPHPPPPPPAPPSPGPAQAFSRMMKRQVFAARTELFHQNMPLKVDPAKCQQLCAAT
jgi:hypothetical protein